VALGVAYPVGSLIQGPVADRIGIGWTTTGSALLLMLVLGVIAVLRPAVRHALFGPPPARAAGGPPGTDVLGETVAGQSGP
jgi:predicted MFS family arabinose efflux permease